MNKKIHGYLTIIGKVSDKIREETGKYLGFMPITPPFVALLEAEGVVPQFDYVEGFGLCWVWLVWDNIQIVSTPN